VLLVDGVAGRLFAVSLPGGDRILLSGVDRGAGPAPVRLVDVVLGAGTAYLVDEGADALYSVNRTTGDRQAQTSPAPLRRPRALGVLGSNLVVGGEAPRALVGVPDAGHIALGAVAGLAPWPGLPVLFGTDRCRGAVFVLFATTGERALIWN
jgi:hypothetical protein